MNSYERLTLIEMSIAQFVLSGRIDDARAEAQRYAAVRDGMRTYDEIVAALGARG